MLVWRWDRAEETSRREASASGLFFDYRVERAGRVAAWYAEPVRDDFQAFSGQITAEDERGALADIVAEAEAHQRAVAHLMALDGLNGQIARRAGPHKDIILVPAPDGQETPDSTEFCARIADFLWHREHLFSRHLSVDDADTIIRRFLARSGLGVPLSRFEDGARVLRLRGFSPATEITLAPGRVALSIGNSNEAAFHDVLNWPILAGEVLPWLERMGWLQNLCDEHADRDFTKRLDVIVNARGYTAFDIVPVLDERPLVKTDGRNVIAFPLAQDDARQDSKKTSS